MPPTTKPDHYNVQLTPRDLALIYDVARFKFLTSHQLHRLHFAGTSPENAFNRLRSLAQGGVLSIAYLNPKARGLNQNRPTAVFYCALPNQHRLRERLEASGHAAEWARFQAVLSSYNKSEAFAHQTLAHETAISEFFVALERDTGAGGHELLFWERTSPFSKELSENLEGTLETTAQGKVTQKTLKLHFNPDAFFSLRAPDGTPAFYFLEYDNNTSGTPRFLKKLLGYALYNSRKLFPPVVERYMVKYQFTHPDPARAGFRVLTLTPSPARRDALFLTSAKLAPSRMFLFATLDDATGNALAPVCLRKREYLAIKDALDALKGVAPVLRHERTAAALAALPKVSLLAD
jgi:hypothetical protein